MGIKSTPTIVKIMSVIPNKERVDVNLIIADSEDLGLDKV